MAWIELHQSLRDHRKILLGADELNIPPAHMVGLLSLLWLWAIDNAEDGDLSRVTSRALARAAQWEGDAETFVAAIEEAGFIDSGTRVIHDWLDYSGRLLEQREQKRAQNRLRQQRFRENQTKQQPRDNNDVITNLSHENNALLSGSTLPDLTRPNQTLLKSSGAVAPKGTRTRAKATPQKFTPPTLEEVKAYCKERESNVDPKKFFDYFEAGRWIDSAGKPVRNWKQKLITWEQHSNHAAPKSGIQEPPQKLQFSRQV